MIEDATEAAGHIIG